MKAAISAARKPNPTYKEVCTGTTGHAEAIRVTYDPHTISLGEMYDVFLGTHDPTQLNRQGGDVGTQYRSAIFPLSDAQAAEAEAAIARWNADNGKVAVTTIEGLSGGEQTAQWYPAEGYHQEYWDGEGQRNPYCQAVIPPKLMKLRKSFSEVCEGLGKRPPSHSRRPGPRAGVPLPFLS